MRLKDPTASEVRTRREVCDSLLPLANARVLELGCGAGDIARELFATPMRVDLLRKPRARAA